MQVKATWFRDGFQCRSRSTVMLQTSRILIPSVVLSLTILGLAIIYNGGCMDARAGDGRSFRIYGQNSVCTESGSR